MNNKLSTILTILFVWIIFSDVLFPQEQPEQQTVTEETEKPQFYKVSEIPQKLEENSFYLQTLKIKVESSMDSSLTDSSWNDYLQKKEKEKALSDRLKMIAKEKKTKTKVVDREIKQLEKELKSDKNE